MPKVNSAGPSAEGRRPTKSPPPAQKAKLLEESRRRTRERTKRRITGRTNDYDFRGRSTPALPTRRSAYPFAVLGLPFSLLGGALRLPPSAYQPVVGALLLIAGAQMVHSAMATKPLDRATPDLPPFRGSLLVGGLIGLASGVTGVGGGIFLAPLVLSLGWATMRQTAAISVVFNLMNSAAALAGAWATFGLLPAHYRSGDCASGVEGSSALGSVRCT